MEDETQKILEEQLKILPDEVISFLASNDWDTEVGKIGSLYNLSDEKIFLLKNEVFLVVAGILKSDSLKGEIGREVDISGEILDSIVTDIQKFLEPIRLALLAFFEEGVANLTPENIPTEENENPFIPKLIAKEPNPELHPFEQKMQQTITPTTSSVQMNQIITPAPTPAPDSPQVVPVSIPSMIQPTTRAIPVFTSPQPQVNIAIPVAQEELPRPVAQPVVEFTPPQPPQTPPASSHDSYREPID